MKGTLAVASLLLGATVAALANTSLHTTWLWHVHQPIYWPGQSSYVGVDHYENAWDTIRQQGGGRPHPSPEILRQIFGLDDRIAAYQGRLRDAVGDRKSTRLNSSHRT